jgi:hypothetical protein
VALADPAALHDPLVVRLDDLLEIRVGQDPLGRVGADPGDPRSRHSRPPFAAPARDLGVQRGLDVLIHSGAGPLLGHAHGVLDGFHW